MTGRCLRTVAAVLAAALISSPCQVAASTSVPVDPTPESPSSASAGATDLSVVATLAPGAIHAGVRRRADAESQRLSRSGQRSEANTSTKCSASLAEKLAWIYALVGGSILLVYGPQEKDADVWTLDGKSETVAGGTAVVLSFALLRDIRRKGP